MRHAEPGRIAGRGQRSREPLSRADKIFVAMFAALLGSGAVGFTAINGQLLGLQRQMGDLRTEMHQEIGTLSDRMTRIETLIETRLAPPPDGSSPPGP